MTADLVLAVHITPWTLLGAIIWATVAYVVRERRAAAFERAHLVNMERMHERHKAEMTELYSHRWGDDDD